MVGLQGKRVLFGVTGSIAAYKAADWVRSLVKEEAQVTVVMTRAAERFIAPLTFSALTGNFVYRDMFDDESERVMAHINLSRDADVIFVAPATAQTISRLANGIADDLLSTAILAAKTPVVLCPAMNSNMLSHPATQENIKRLRLYGYQVVQPNCGALACGETGDGRLPDWDIAREAVLGIFASQDLKGLKVLITAGPTREPLDPVRYLSNRSSGKMGFALARTACRRGAEVVLISGPVHLPNPPGVEVVRVTTAEEMKQAVMERLPVVDVVVKAAAVADFKPSAYQKHKIKKSKQGLCLDLIKNADILAELGKCRRSEQVLIGFAAESQNHVAEGVRKLKEKNLDLIVVNDILGKQTGFDVETNQVTLIDKKENFVLPLMTKESTANKIWDRVTILYHQKKDQRQLKVEE